MKTVILFTLTISLSLSAAAQVYQPRLDQDNTSATLPDTIKFVLDTANDPTLNTGGIAQTEDIDAYDFQTFAASSPTLCSLSWSYLLVDYGSYNMGAGTDRTTYQVDLSKVDLSSIKAAPANYGFGVQLAAAPATPASPLGTDTLTHFNQDHGLAWFEHNKYWKSLSEAQTAPCNPKDKKCSVKQSNVSTVTLVFNNQDSAQRVSRALLHAALLCGAKASAPPARLRLSKTGPPQICHLDRSVSALANAQRRDPCICLRPHLRKSLRATSHILLYSPHRPRITISS